jgi:hypothetical protein
LERHFPSVGRVQNLIKSILRVSRKQSGDGLTALESYTLEHHEPMCGYERQISRDPESLGYRLKKVRRVAVHRLCHRPTVGGRAGPPERAGKVGKPEESDGIRKKAS